MLWWSLLYIKVNQSYIYIYIYICVCIYIYIYMYIYIYIYIYMKAMATHSSTLAWKISWTEEPGGLQSMGSLRVGHDRSNLAAVYMARLLVLYSSFLLVICFTHDSIYMSMLLSQFVLPSPSRFVSLRLFSASVSPFILCE